jgi:purine nucleosidase
MAARTSARRAATRREPVSLIIDTDLSIDVDDVGALCAAHALADLGKVDLLAVVHDTGFDAGIAAVSAINDYYGRSNIRLGAYRGPVGRLKDTLGPWWVNKGRGAYVADLLAVFPHSQASDAEPALRVYRTVLNAASAASVNIVSIGHTTNLLDLLRSGPDTDSPLSGVDLVKTRVQRMVIMGGRPDEVEWNLGACGVQCGAYYHVARATNETLSLWPVRVPMVFVDFDAGVSIQTGGVGVGEIKDCVNVAQFQTHGPGFLPPCARAAIDFIPVAPDES